MRDAIRDLRRLLAGEEVAFGPTTTRLRNRSAHTDAGVSAGGRPPHDRTRGRSGRWRISHGRPASGGHPRRVASPGGRRQAGRPLAGRLPGGVRGHARSRTRCRDRSAMGAELVRARSAVPRLSERRESSLAAGSRLRRSRQRTIPPPSPRTARARSRMHSDCSARRNVVRSDSCVRARRPALTTSSCSRRMILPAATTCRRPRSGASSESSARGSEDKRCGEPSALICSISARPTIAKPEPCADLHPLHSFSMISASAIVSPDPSACRITGLSSISAIRSRYASAARDRLAISSASRRDVDRVRAAEALQQPRGLQAAQHLASPPRHRPARGDAPRHPSAPPWCRRTRPS